MNMENLGALLPWWLLGVPLLGGLIELVRTPKAHVGNEHSSMGGMGMPSGGAVHPAATRPMADTSVR